jgi:hypothetical protein
MVDARLDDLYAQLSGSHRARHWRRRGAERVRGGRAPRALRRWLVDALAYPEIDQALEHSGIRRRSLRAHFRRRRALAMQRAALVPPVVGRYRSRVRSWPMVSRLAWAARRRLARVPARFDAMTRDRRLRAIVLRIDAPGLGLGPDLWRRGGPGPAGEPVVISWATSGV